MIVPPSIDQSKLDTYTDDELVRRFVDEAGYTEPAARHAVRQLRGTARRVAD